jgi:fibronectin type III domain protein
MRRFALLMALLVVAVGAIGLNASAALALSPAVETLPASSIGEKGATLNGTVNPNGGETKAFFEYGTSTSYGSKTAEVAIGSGTTTLGHSQAVTGLTANTVYHYRIVASNPSGSSQGIDRTFTTVGPPAVSGLTSTPETKTGESATLKASVDPNGQSTTYQFEYGKKSGEYTNVLPIPAESAGSGYEPVPVDVNVSGLTPGTTYYWRVSATNSSGKVSSSQASFTSSFHPSFQVNPVTELSRTGATLNATIKVAETYWFEYGTTTSYGAKTPLKKGSLETTASEHLSFLKPNTVYHYRLIAENIYGTHASSDLTFTTLAPATLALKGGGEIKVGANLKAFSTSLTFTGESGVHSCTEAEFSGSVQENPGAVQAVSTTRFQTGGFRCPWKSGFDIAYTFPTKGTTIEYAKNLSGEGFVYTSTFTILATSYFGGFKAAECEYSLRLTGTFKTGVALEPTLAGKTVVIKSTPEYCPGAESVSGKFVVTSSGVPVEAK